MSASGRTTGYRAYVASVGMQINQEVVEREREPPVAAGSIRCVYRSTIVSFRPTDGGTN